MLLLLIVIYYSSLDETDYGRIAESDFSAFLQFNDMNRRQCATLMIVNDEALENTESLTIDLVFSSLFTPPSGVILDPNVTTVVILDDDGMSMATYIYTLTDGNYRSKALLLVIIYVPYILHISTELVLLNILSVLYTAKIMYHWRFLFHFFSNPSRGFGGVFH